MSDTAQRLVGVVGRFPSVTLAVAGDLVADEYLYCRTSRISREAPAALILTYQDRDLRPGGGANAVANIRALGGSVEPVGVVGDDATGHELVEVLRAMKIDTSGVLLSDTARTVVKTRIMTSTYHSTKQQVLRLDREFVLPLEHAARAGFERALGERLERADALLIADYGYGSARPEWLAASLGQARARRLPVTVDSRHRLSAFAGVSAATPNEEEVEELAGKPVSEDETALLEAGESLREQLGAEALLVTRGSRGMALLERGRRPELLGVFGSDEVADVTGAGDTVIATFTLALAAGASFSDAARLANCAGGLVVMKRGTATVSASELVAAVLSLK